jgi:aspartate aminotransferase
MRKRAEEMRCILYEALSGQFGKDKFSFLKRRHGLFSMLGMPPEQVDRMLDEYGVYLARSGRVNLTGLSEENITYVIESIVKTMG